MAGRRPDAKLRRARRRAHPNGSQGEGGGRADRERLRRVGNHKVYRMAPPGVGLTIDPGDGDVVTAGLKRKRRTRHASVSTEALATRERGSRAGSAARRSFFWIGPLLALALATSPPAHAQEDQPRARGAYQFGVFPYVPTLTIDRIFGPMAGSFAIELGRPVDLRTKPTFEQFAKEIERQSYEILFVHPFFYVGGCRPPQLSARRAPGRADGRRDHGRCRSTVARSAGPRGQGPGPAAGARCGQRADPGGVDRGRTAARCGRRAASLPDQDVLPAGGGDRLGGCLRGAEVRPRADRLGRQAQAAPARADPLGAPSCSRLTQAYRRASGPGFKRTS
jgi:hypothetical protein